jgi:3-oxoacyl-[acyl-carrier protein] reductase
MDSRPKGVAGRVALVVGGFGGIGSAITAALQQAGARVVVAGRTPAPLVGELPVGTVQVVGEGESVAPTSYCVCDVRDPAACRALTGEIMARHGRLDIVIDCSNPKVTGVAGRFGNADPDRFGAFLEATPGALFNLCHATLPLLSAGGGGSILAFASDAGNVSGPNQALVGASRAAVMMFVRSLALEVASDGVRINCISTSFVPDTPVYAEVMAGPTASRARRAAQRAGLGLPVAADIAEVALFLCGPGASHLTGQVVSVNGGLSAGL